jgi:hypothetical protein
MEIPPTGRPSGIGFVLRILPPAPARNRAKLASFCAFGLRRPPAAGPIGFVLHVSALRRSGVPARLLARMAEIWFCSAHLPSARAKLGSFCAFCLRPSHRPSDNGLFPHTPVHPSLASFCTIPFVSRSGGAELGSFCAFALQSGQIGFVLRIHPAAGPNWVRFAHFASGVRPQPASSNPQSSIRNREPPASLASHLTLQT